MKPVRLLCVAVALCVCAAVAWGAGTATAAELCADPNCEEVYESGQTIQAEVPFEGAATFTSSLGALVCGHAALTGETTASSGEPLTAEISSAIFEECTLGETACTVTAVNLPYDAAFEETTEGNGTLTIESGGSGSPGAKLVCGGLTCTGTTAQVPLDVSSGAPAVLSAASVELAVTGSLCPMTAEWSPEYIVIAPLPVQVGPTATVLCTAAPDGKGVCPKGKQFGGGKVFGEQASGSATFQTHPGAAKIVTCKKASFEGDYDKAGVGKVEKMIFAGEGANACTSNFPATFVTKKDPPVTVTLEVLPFTNSSFKYKPAGGVQGEFTFGPTFQPDGTPKVTTRLELYVENKILCTYRWTGIPKGGSTPFTVSNGGASHTTLGMGPIWIGRSEKPAEGVCPLNLQQFTNLALTRTEVNEENDIYVANSVAP